MPEGPPSTSGGGSPDYGGEGSAPLFGDVSISPGDIGAPRGFVAQEMDSDELRVPDSDFSTDPNQLNKDFYEGWREIDEPGRQGFIDASKIYGDDLIGAASERSDSLRGSAGYTDAQDQFNEWDSIYSNGGLTDSTKAMLAGTRADEEQWLRSQREADMANLAERGMSGGGAELAAQLGARGAAADRMSRADLETAAFAEQQRLDALQNRGAEADKIYGYDTDFADHELSAKAEAASDTRSVMDQIYSNEQAIVGNIARDTRQGAIKALGESGYHGGGSTDLGDTTRANVDNTIAGVSGSDPGNPGQINTGYDQGGPNPIVPEPTFDPTTLFSAPGAATDLANKWKGEGQPPPQDDDKPKAGDTNG